MLGVVLPQHLHRAHNLTLSSSTFLVNGDAYFLPYRLHTRLGLNSNGSLSKYLSYINIESNVRFFPSSLKYYQANNYCNLVLERKTVSNNRI